MEKSKIGRRFEGKVAIVTASTQGIGFAIAERLGLEGASVVISSRKQVILNLCPFVFHEIHPDYRSGMISFWFLWKPGSKDETLNFVICGC